MKSLQIVLLNALLVLALASCKGSSTTAGLDDTGGGGGTTTGDDTGDDTTTGDGTDELTFSYSIPSQLVLVGNTEDEPSGSFSGALGFRALGDTSVTDDDFATDAVSEYVYDGTGDYLATINQMFCALAQTQYTDSAVLDQGVQIILVNTSKCAPDYFYQTSGSSSADTYEEWLVDARTNEDGTATVYFRIKGSANGVGSLGFWYESIDGQLNVTEGVSETNQIGIFELNATGYYNDEVIFNTTLASLPRDDGNIQLQFLMEYPSESYSYSSGVNAILDPSGASGQALVNYTSTFNGDGQGGNTSGGAAGGAASESGVTYETTMQINYDTSHVRTAYASDGWDFEQCVDRTDKTETFVSYNLYSENESGGLDRVDLNTGMSFKTQNDVWGYASSWGVYAGEDLSDGDTVHGDDGADYTVTVGEGMLMATFKDAYPFTILDGKEIYGYDSVSYVSYIMAWDSDTESFQKTKEFSCGDSGCNYFDITPETVALAAGSYFYWVNGVGSVDFTVPELGLSNESEFFVSSYEYVSPTDADVQGDFELKCFYSCPKGGLTQEDINNNAVYYSDNEIHYYTLDLENFDLIEASDGAVNVNGLDMSASYYSWGYTSGPMIAADSDIADSSQVNSADAIYTWQVGTNQWNRYTGLIDSGNQAVSFDSMLSCLYENDDGTFILQYYDQGQLFGIPYVSTTDDETGFTTYSSQFRIPDRDTMTCDGQSYAAKAVFLQYQMATVSNAECESLAIDPLDAADLDFETPDLPDMTPAGEAPAVIGGVVQSL